MRTDDPRVLLVTDRHSVEDSFGRALVRHGFEVTQCPGPRPPDYTCVGGCGGRCALAAATDAVVLDADLGGDLVGLGTRAWDLLHYYRDRGLPVVVLADADDLTGWFEDEGIPILPHASDPHSVVAAVDRVLAARTNPST